jgi:hypothetical protein
MLKSHVIEVDGTFVGAAVRQSDGFRFVAVDYRLEELHDSVLPSLADLERLARKLLLTGSLRDFAARPRAAAPLSHEMAL